MRNVKVFFFIVIANLFCSNCIHAQIGMPGWKWGISSTLSYNPGIDVWAGAVDDSGNVLLTGYTAQEWGGSIKNYMVYGADTVYNLTHHQQQIVVKADSNGNFLWAKGSQHGDAWPLGIAADRNGNIYVFGAFSDSTVCAFDTFNVLSASLSMYYLVKYSPAGNVLWAKNVVGDSRDVSTIGAIGIDDANNIYVTGAFDLPSVTIGGTTLMNSSALGDTFDVFIAKYDPLGNPIWAKNFGGNLDDYPSGMTVTGSGGVYLSGQFKSRSMTVGSTMLNNSYVRYSYPQPMTFFTKLDSSGNIIWAQELNYTLSINGLTHDALENIYMVGSMDSNVILGTDTLIDEDNNDLFLAKYDSSGNMAWANSAGSTGNDYGWSISVDNCNNVWIAGDAPNYGTFINFNGDSLSIPSGSDPAFIAEYSDSGKYKSGMAFPSGGDDVDIILADRKGHVYFAGDYEKNELVFGSDTLSVFAGSGEELFIAKYGPTDCAPEIDTTKTDTGGHPLLTHVQTTLPVSISIYPNPATDECTINSSTPFPPHSIAQIYDMSGKLLKVALLSGNNNIISLTGFAPGIYQCHITAGDGYTVTKKLIVMR